jgi:hypothetical protein
VKPHVEAKQVYARASVSRHNEEDDRLEQGSSNWSSRVMSHIDHVRADALVILRELQVARNTALSIQGQPTEGRMRREERA